ncbi:uncharacterized protein LOC119605774 [Lucilia sericata]|uniref:uncharacterized protein LOC119605774 n=1 Tax=Lucilia sericata TaxID=13632 RepID=UPI0018A860E6|nr:uncharacterized protein LOC119605774 [Lucilia sericata]
MSFKYFLMCCLLPLVLSQYQECKFPESDPEHTAAIDLVYGREYCVDMYVKCSNAHSDTCMELYDKCLKNMIEEYKTTISGYEVSRNRFNEVEEEAGMNSNCDSICFYQIIYRRLSDDRVFCE